jgi:hypothetical protein
MEFQEEIDRLADAIYRDKVLRARGRTLDERIREGMECFDLSCRLMADGVRQQFHPIDEPGVWRKVGERLDRLRRMEERGIYQPYQDPQ